VKLTEGYHVQVCDVNWSLSHASLWS